MRKIAANYVFPVAGEPIRNGYVKFNDNNEVVEIGQLEGECADTEFYSGILCPGFTNAHNHVELSHLVLSFFIIICNISANSLATSFTETSKCDIMFSGKLNMMCSANMILWFKSSLSLI